MKLGFLVFFFIYSSLSFAIGGGDKYPNLTTHKESIEHFQDLRFGLFVHWGPVS